MRGDERAYDEFVRARLPHLLRFGRALALSDPGGAVLVADALAGARARWDQSSAQTAEDDVRRSMVRRFLRHPPGELDATTPGRDQATWAALGDLGRKERAMVALLVHEKLSSAQAAGVLGCSDGTARALADRALAGLDRDRLRLALDEPAEADQSALLAGVRREADRRRRRRSVLIAGAGVAVAAALTGVALLAAPRDSAPEPGLAGDAFALAVSDADHVWVVTDEPYCSRCSTLWAGDGTPDGWRRVTDIDRLPLVAEILMAPNGRDGWAWFGRDWLQATHDGGKTWVIPGIDLRDSNVDVQLAGSRVWALLTSIDETRLFSSEVGSDAWTEEVPPRGGDRHALVPLRDQMLVMTYLPGDTAVLAPASAPDESSRIPCSRSPRPPRSVEGTLWVTCPDPEGGGVTVMRSTDGRSWTEVKASTRTVPVTYPVSDEATFLVSFEGGRLVGADGVVDVPLGLLDQETVEDGVFPTPEVGFLLTNQGRVLRSDDGGHSWQEVG